MPAKRKTKKVQKKAPARLNKNQWEDHLTRKARARGYPARSVYKLEEIQQKFGIMKTRDRILDLGCAPGSWSLYASEQVGATGKVFGIDLKPIEILLPRNVTAIKADILHMANDDFWMEAGGLDVLLSDMAPATTGRKDVDALRSSDLCEMALHVADMYLKPGGHFVCKIFQGSDFNAFQKQVKFKFKTCKIFKPDSCRKQSKEIYIIAKGKNKEG